MKDDRLRRRPAEPAVLREARVRASCLAKRRSDGRGYAGLLVAQRHRVVQRRGHSGSYVYGVYRSGLRPL